ncbi:MAG: MFS transporter, partial [Promethearchaeota archaeon]
MFRSFHSRSFILVFLSSIIMSVGNFMQMVALGWLVLDMTNSAMSLGIVWATRSAPHLIWGLLAGAVADKVDRRRLLIIVFMVLGFIAFLMGILISKDLIHLWQVMLFSFIMGSISTFATPARQALVVDIVGRTDTMGAIAINAVGMRIIGIFGGAASGFIIYIFGMAWPFYFMCISYSVGVFVLFFIQVMQRQIPSNKQTLWGNFLEGLQIVSRNRIVLVLMIMAAVCEIFGFSHTVLQPIFARDILKIGVVGLGMFSTARSVGGLLAGLYLASLGDYKHKGRLMLCIFLFFGVSLVLFAQSHWYLLSLVIIGVVGAMAAGYDAMQHILLQLNVTDEQRGRAIGIWQLSIGFGPLGSYTLGALAMALGARLAQSIYGVVMIGFFLGLVIFI